MASLEKGSALQEKGEMKESNQADLQRRASAVRARARKFMATLVATKASSSKEISDMESYFANMRLEEKGLSGIHDREVFFEGENGIEGWGTKMERDAITLHRTFTHQIDRAAQSGILSEKSKQKWMERFNDKAVGFKAKEYWVYHQLGHYMQAWEKVVAERDTLLKDSRLADIIQYDPRFAVIKDKNAFLDLHYDKRKGILAEARAALLATDKLQLDLYAKAQQKLRGAASKGILAHGKVGTWLERIFKGNADPKKIEAFVNGKGNSSLADLMINWHEVRGRYDEIASKFKDRKEQTAPRGLHLLTPAQFLSLHYTQRLRYVEEMERRLTDSPDPEHERPDFLEIRHAIDVKDWAEAELLIAEAKKTASGNDKERLKSMERYVSQFKQKKEGAESIENVTEARHKLDELLGQVPSSLQPMVLRLLRGPKANRSIHQFRWIVYNNKWCRTHGYLNRDKAKQGASDENKELTKQRSRDGEDVGRNDVLDNDTSGQEFIRKKEYANHKATLMHVNTQGSAPGTLAQWLEREQNPKVLYWTTFCGNENGEPMSDNWHNDLLMILNQMRSLTRTINNAGYMYDGPGRKLHSLN